MPPFPVSSKNDVQINHPVVADSECMTIDGSYAEFVSVNLSFIATFVTHLMSHPLVIIVR